MRGLTLMPRPRRAAIRRRRTPVTPVVLTGRAVPKVRAALGRRLIEMRHERQMSQHALGAGAGLSAKFIGEVERGQKSISLDSLARVATALGVRLHEIVQFE